MIRNIDSDPTRLIAKFGLFMTGATIASAVMFAISPSKLGALIVSALFVGVLLTRLGWEVNQRDLA